MLQRVPVAGDVTDWSSISKGSDTCSGVVIRSSLMSVLILSSSMTGFMLSIQGVSAAPSNTIRFSCRDSSAQVVRITSDMT